MRGSGQRWRLELQGIQVYECVCVYTHPSVSVVDWFQDHETCMHMNLDVFLLLISLVLILLLAQPKELLLSDGS